MEKFPCLTTLGFTVPVSERLEIDQVADKYITNKLLLELNTIKEKSNCQYTYQDVLNWICSLCGKENVTNKSLYLKVKSILLKIKTTVSKLKKSKQNSEHVENYLNLVIDTDTLLEIPHNSRIRKNNLIETSDTEKNSNVKSKKRKTIELKYRNKSCTWREAIKKLNFKLQNCEKKLRQTKRKLKISKIQNKMNQKRYTKVFKLMTKRRSKTELETKRDKEKVRYWKSQTNKIKQQTQTKLDNLRTAVDTHEEIHRLNRLEITDLKNRIHDLELELERNDHTVEIDLTKHSKFGRYTYTAETDLCIMELLNCHVPFDRVDTVIKSVLSLCNFKAKHETLPKKDYVSSVNVRRLAISQAHIAETCIEENRTLYTDETRKNGQSYGVFITSNENQEPCLMGLKHMSSKASKTELETLKEILKEIEDRTQYLQNENPPSSAYNILKNITNTMSDRAATEKSFQQLLQDYRTSLLKENIDNFNELSEPDQLLITKMNNFFCGLHLLVNIADLMCSIFKEWEQTVMNTQVGGESTIIKTVREVCKAFVPGVDNKNGASLELKTYLSRINVKFQLKAFQGNRFNIVFNNGGVIYYLHEHFIYFLENIKSEGNTNTLNMLMKDVLRNLKCSHNIVGLRALGVFNKFITTPLWKIIEADNTHILDMNALYHNLIQFLEDVATNVESANELLTGERRPFPNIKIKKDEVWEVLVKQQTNDAETVSLLMQMAAATCKSLKEKVKDHLPGGKFENVTAEVQIQMKSVIPHNKLPEWVFGYLDWLLKHRPNSTRLANEAHIVYKLNKTSEWLHKKSELEIEKLVQWSKKMLPVIKFQEKEKIKEIKKQMEDLSKAKEEKSKTKKAKQQEEKRELLDAIFVQGLWKSRQEIDMKLQQKLKTQKRKMLTSQIKFRQLILEQSADKKTFQISRFEGKPVTVDMLISNLEILIRLENVPEVEEVEETLQLTEE